MIKKGEKMSLQDYTVKRDKFEAKLDLVYGFPCNACKHIHKPCHDEPCQSCDHNVNAIDDSFPDTKDK